MTTLNQSTTHEEHQEAECEHVIWLEDIGRWRSEHRRAAAMLAQAQASLLEQDAALESHAETVRSHESRLQRFERDTSARERGGGEPTRDVSADSHREFQIEHDHARDAHQRIQQYHDMVTMEIRRLAEKLSAPM